MFLRTNYETMSTAMLSDILGRTVNAIQKHAAYIGVRISEEEKNRRAIENLKAMRSYFGNMYGDNNPNWKGGRSKNSYFYKLRQMERYPDRVNARRILHVAIKSGKLSRKPCEICGEPKSHAHHDDYSKPLDVVWLCLQHHKERHGWWGGGKSEIVDG